MSENFFTFNITVEGIVDDAHLDELIDAINGIAYVSNISKVSANHIEGVS